MPEPSGCAYRFDDFVLEPAQRRLLHGGRPMPLTPRAFDLLLLLVERAGQLVTKDEILERVWAGVVVEENNLQVQVSALRKVLGGKAIETVSGKGYRFLPVLATDDTAAVAGRTSPGNVPRALTTYVQRDGQLTRCMELLDKTRLLTLTGVGGLGKTRLSLEMAGACEGRYADGVWFVDLAAIDDARRVSEAVALVIGVVEQTAERLLDVMQSFVRKRRMLLILDNCEHLLRGCADLANRLLREAANLKILATSREPLHVAGEAIYAVRTLAVPDAGAALAVDALATYDAVQLFVDRATAAQPSFRLTERNARAVSEICARLDGIPLAIELAAARVRVVPVETIAERLHDRFRLLTGGDRTAPSRQQTLRATLDWSYALLTGAEQRVLQRVTVFAGGWTLEAAEAVCGGDGIDALDVLDLQGDLVDKSLVVLDDERARYRLLETVREYAQERLHSSEDADRTRTRHLEYHVALAERAEPELIGPDEDAWLARFDVERQNLLAAYAWSKNGDGGAELALRLAYGARRWMCRGAVDLGKPALATELQRIGSEPRLVRAQGLFAAAFVSYYTGRYDDTCRYGEAAISSARAIGDARIVAEATAIVGSGHLAGDLGKARRYLEDAVALARSIDDPVLLADFHIFLGELESTEGNLDFAHERYETALALARELRSNVFTTVALLNLARISISRASYVRAVRMLQEALWGAGAAGSARQAPYFLAFSAALAAGLGHPEDCARFFGAARRLLEEMLLGLEPADEAAVMPPIEAVRSADSNAFAAAEAAGHALRRDDALAELAAWLSRLEFTGQPST